MLIWVVKVGQSSFTGRKCPNLESSHKFYQGNLRNKTSQDHWNGYIFEANCDETCRTTFCWNMVVLSFQWCSSKRKAKP